MFEDLFDEKDIKNFKTSKYVNALKGISIYANKTPKKQRHYLISTLRISGLSIYNVQDLGFKCSFNLWKSCLNTNDRHLGGRKPVSNDLKEKINDHMKNLSVYSSYRTVFSRSFNERNPTVIYKKKTV